MCVAESSLSTDCKIIVCSLETSGDDDTKAKDKKDKKQVPTTDSFAVGGGGLSEELAELLRPRADFFKVLDSMGRFCDFPKLFLSFLSFSSSPFFQKKACCLWGLNPRVRIQWVLSPPP